MIKIIAGALALAALPCHAQTVRDGKQAVGGGGQATRIGGALKDNPYNLLPNMVALTNAQVVRIQKSPSGQPALILEEGGQAYQIRNFPEGTYTHAARIGPVILVKGIDQLRENDRRTYLWFGTNAVTQEQVTRHESSALALLYPLN